MSACKIWKKNLPLKFDVTQIFKFKRIFFLNFVCPNFTYKKRLMKWCHNDLTKIFWQIHSPFYFLDFNRPSSSLAGHYQYMGNDNAPDYANLTSISRRGAGYYNTQCGIISFISDFFFASNLFILEKLYLVQHVINTKKSLSWDLCSTLEKWKQRILICSVNLQLIFLYIIYFVLKLAIFQADD